jgi:hypothetical protein
MLFSEKWAFNRAGKTVSKIGIYALPPPKSGFYGEFIEILCLNRFWHDFLFIFGP